MKFENYELRIITQEDAVPFFQLIENNRARLEDFFAGVLSKTKNLADTEIFIADIIEKHIAKSYYPYVIIDTGTQGLIGYIDAKNIDWSIPKAEFGYFIGEDYTGKGIASNALGLISDYFFSELGMIKLLLRIYEGNKASRRAAEKCGFIAEGTIRKDYRTTRGEVVDMMYYGKINGLF